MDENNQGLQWSHIEPLCILRALARQLWMLLLAALTCAMAAWIVLTCFVTQQYTSSTTFSVTTRTSNLYYTNITAAADVAASYSQLLQSRVLRQTMEQNLGMPLNGTVSAQQLGETNLIRVTVTAGTPRQALVLLKAVSDNYGSLSAHVSSTAVLSQLNSPSLSVAPSRSYNVPRICLMAAIAGAALTALGVAWASVTSGTVQTQEGARSDLDAKLISTVPHEGRRTRKLLGWMDDRRERRSRRAGKRLRRNLNISSPPSALPLPSPSTASPKSSSMSTPRAAGYSCFPACPRQRANPPWPPTRPFPWPPGGCPFCSSTWTCAARCKARCWACP